MFDSTRETVQLSDEPRLVPALHPPASTDPAVQDAMSIVVFSGDLDRLLATLNMATGAAAMGTKVDLFFTFWATAALRARPARRKRSLIERVLGWILPRGAANLELSALKFGGLGTAMMRRRMRSKNVAGLEELFELAKELSVRIHVCEMSLDLLGMHIDDLIDYPGMQCCGVATFMSYAMASKVTMFV